MGQSSSAGPAGPPGPAGAPFVDPELPFACSASAGGCAVTRPLAVVVGGKTVLRCDQNGCAFPQGLRVADGGGGPAALVVTGQDAAIGPRLVGARAELPTLAFGTPYEINDPDGCGVRLLRGVCLPQSAPLCGPQDDRTWPTRVSLEPAEDPGRARARAFPSRPAFRRVAPPGRKRAALPSSSSSSRSLFRERAKNGTGATGPHGAAGRAGQRQRGAHGLRRR